MKNYNKNIESSYLLYLDTNNLYEWEMSQKLPANDFEQVEELSVFGESFIKNYDENINKGYILEVNDKKTDAKNDFEKDFFKLTNNAVFGKTMENLGKYRDIALVTADKRRNQLASEPNYHATKYFLETLMHQR